MKFVISQRDDRQGLYSLWQSAFGDSRDFIDRFFSVLYKEENALVCRDGGRVVSMLFIIEANIIIKSEKRKAFYVYAAATDEKYRNRGLMSRLLNFAGETARGRGADFLFLHPASRSLYDFYEKNGFCTRFYKRNAYIDRNSLEKISFQSYNYIEWDNKTIDFNSHLSGGEAFKGKFGYADVKIKSGSLYVNSFCAEKPAGLLCEVMEKYGFDGAFVNFPSRAEGVSGRRVKTGMILNLNGDNYEIDDIYLGITLE